MATGTPVAAAALLMGKLVKGSVEIGNQVGDLVFRPGQAEAILTALDLVFQCRQRFDAPVFPYINRRAVTPVHGGMAVQTVLLMQDATAFHITGLGEAGAEAEEQAGYGVA